MDALKVCRCCMVVVEKQLTVYNMIPCCSYCVGEIKGGKKMFKNLSKNASLKFKLYDETDSSSCVVCDERLAPQVDGQVCPDCLQYSLECVDHKGDY